MHRIWGWKRLACLVALAAAGQVSAQKFPFLPIPGAPHGIFQIFQDSHSGMWLGTIDDVVRFDGEHFYSLRPYGFPKEIPNGFAEDSDGGIWIATQGTDVGGGTGRGGVYRYRAGRVEKELAGDGLGLVPLGPGLMLAATGTEASGKPTYGDLVLFRKSAQGWTATTLLSNQADHLSLDHQGNLLFPCPGGWCEIAGQQLQGWQNASSPLQVQRHAASPLTERVLRDKFGCVWIRTETFASYQCPADPQPVTLPQTIAGADSSDHLEETADGSIFMLVPMVLGRPGHFHGATQTNGLPYPNDTATVAKDGTIWIGADAGLYRFTYPFQVEYWDKTVGLPGAFSIVKQGDDVFTTYDFIYKMEKDRYHWNQFIPIDKIEAIWPGPDGSLFADGVGELAQIDSKGKNVVALARTSDGTTFLGRSSLYRVVQQGKRFIFLRENVPQGSIRDMKYDEAHDTLWVCDSNRVIFRKDGRWGEIAQKDGLLNLPCAAIGIEADGDIWVGYQSKAAAFIHNPASSHPVVHNFSQWINELASNGGTSYMLADGRDHLWWGVDALYVSSPAAAKSAQWIRLDSDDWMDADAQSKMIGTIQPAADGSVWLSWGGGITHFSPPDNFASTFPAPSVFVAGFSAGSAAQTLADAIGPIPRNTPLTAHIGMTQFDRRSAIHLRYRILPGQQNWTAASTFDLPLGILSWGRHTLEVQAQLATGPWSPIAEQPFEIPWPLWLTWPAWLLYCASGAGIGFGARTWWQKRQFEQSLALPDLTAWRLGALAPETEALVGTVIDNRYEIGHILSVGGFATVARARDLKQNGALCAVKIFRYELGDRAWIRHRFEQEIAALEQVKHPNIVRITGHGTLQSGTLQSGAPYLVMEFIHGRSLRELLEKGALARPQIAAFLRQLSGALALLHRAQIFHRDLKPENLMIRSGDEGQLEIVLIDFSIAIVKAPDQTFHGISRVAGTLDYMAPEQVIGYADASTDIYSLAKVLLEMVTGLRWTQFLPEAKLDLPDQLRRYFQSHPELFGPDAVEMLVSALAFDPGGRPKEVQHFAQPIIQDLERL